MPRKRYEGKDSEEVEKMLYYMEHSMLVRFAVLEFFFKYKNENEKFIKKEWE